MALSHTPIQGFTGVLFLLYIINLYVGLILAPGLSCAGSLVSQNIFRLEILNWPWMGMCLVMDW